MVYIPTGITATVSSLMKNRRGRDVFVMGMANIGKSAFVRALLKDMRSITSVNFNLYVGAKRYGFKVIDTQGSLFLSVLRSQENTLRFRLDCTT